MNPNRIDLTSSESEVLEMVLTAVEVSGRLVTLMPSAPMCVLETLLTMLTDGWCVKIRFLADRFMEITSNLDAYELAVECLRYGFCVMMKREGGGLEVLYLSEGEWR